MTQAEVIRGDHDQALDGLRGIVARSVVFFHCGVELRFPPLVLPGFSGVHLLFVLGAGLRAALAIVRRA